MALNDWRNPLSRAARMMGFDGKTLIHPSQIETANSVFAPSPDAVQQAQEFIAAHAEALREGKNVAVVRGKLVENLHVADAQRVLALHTAIGQLELDAAGASRSDA